MGWAPRTVRARATAGAVLVVGAALLVSAVVLLVVLRRSSVGSVQGPAQARADDIAAALERGTPTDQLGLEEGPDRFIQVVVGGRVEAASANARAVGSLESREGVGTSTPVADADDEWVVVTAPASTGHTVVVGRELDPPLESVAAAATALAVGLPLLLGLVGLTTWRVVGSALGPVEAIRSEVSGLGAADLGKRVPVPPSGDEIEQLATTMNAMLDRLEAAQRQQRRFVSDASHELRSPLAAIRQHVEVALAHPDRSSLGELAEVVLAEEADLERLVDDLLLLARADEGGLGLRPGVVELHDLVIDEVARLGPSGPEARAEVDMEAVEAVTVTADESTLRRAVRNLIDNAARHAAGHIEIVCGTDGPVESGTEGRWVTVTVHDDGPGIPAAAHREVLRRFTRLDDARSAAGGGAGLGLAIVAEVAAAHRGRVTIGDSPLGGAAVAIRLPVTPAGPSAGSGAAPASDLR